MLNRRYETDSIGTVEIPINAYYGSNTQRAINNFCLSDRIVNIKLIHSVVLIKKAAAMAHKKINEMDNTKCDAIINACDYILTGALDNEFVTHPLQGGAGTSINMNANEVIANKAIELLGGTKGDYRIIDPLLDVNRSQSTNDVFITALRISAIKELRQVSEEFAHLQESLQTKENEFADIIKLGRTQLMDALPIMAGQEFGAYARAISRDRWRLYKVEERLRETNLGGTAIGTGMNASHKYIFTVTDIIRELSGIGLARSEFPIDTTQNLDVFVEVSGLLKSAAVNLIKISNDIRLLASGPKGGFSELILPPVQAGSSIMPGKINPVMAEMIAQIGFTIIGNDSCITTAALSGQLELNAFGPLIADKLLESLQLLKQGVFLFNNYCIKGIRINEEQCTKHLENSTVLVTALLHHIGYEAAAKIAKQSLETNKSIKEIILEQNILPKDKLDKILNPYQVTKPGIPGK